MNGANSLWLSAMRWDEMRTTAVISCDAACLRRRLQWTQRTPGQSAGWPLTSILPVWRHCPVGRYVTTTSRPGLTRSLALSLAATELPSNSFSDISTLAELRQPRRLCRLQYAQQLVSVSQAGRMLWQFVWSIVSECNSNSWTVNDIKVASTSYG